MSRARSATTAEALRGKQVRCGPTGKEHEEEMSIFSTKILLATDGSEEATLAARTAADIAGKTESELHVVHARLMLPWADYPTVAGAPSSGPADAEEARERLMRWLDDQVERVEAEGGSVAQAHLRL